MFIQNISDEPQLVRVQGAKKVLKPGEIAEVTEQESAVTKSYKNLFQEVNGDTKLTPPAVEKDGKKGPYDAMKQADLKTELTKRGIEIPKGPVKNDDLKKLLLDDDVAKLTPPAVEKDDGKDGDDTGASTNKDPE